MRNNDLLLHICCGPCATYPLEVLKADFNVTGFFYNPNIHPYREFKKRLQGAREVLKYYQIKGIFDEEYYLEQFLQAVLQEKSLRCSACYRMRMEISAQKAKDLGIKRFTTTLLISPYQDIEDVIRAGQNAAYNYGLEFLAQDFRPGFPVSREQAKKLNIYRQGYCGCIFSEKERYYGGGK